MSRIQRNHFFKPIVSTVRGIQNCCVMQIKSIKKIAKKFQSLTITKEQMKTVKGGEDIIIEEVGGM